MSKLGPALLRVAQYKHLLGEKFDHEIALIAGVSDSSVLLFRKKFGYHAKRGGFVRGAGSKNCPPKFVDVRCDRCNSTLVVDKIAGEHLCRSCMCPDEKLELNPYSGTSPTCCE